MSFGRNQKYLKRQRHIYALVFSGNRVYIGQSVDIKRRSGQHNAYAGGWHEQFEMIHLSTMYGTHFEAEDHEYAWRYKAGCSGFRVYGKPGLFINPRRRMTWKRKWIAWTAKKWPVKWERQSWWPTIAVCGTLAVAVTGFMLGPGALL